MKGKIELRDVQLNRRVLQELLGFDRLVVSQASCDHVHVAAPLTKLNTQPIVVSITGMVVVLNEPRQFPDPGLTRQLVAQLQSEYERNFVTKILELATVKIQQLRVTIRLQEPAPSKQFMELRVHVPDLVAEACNGHFKVENISVLLKQMADKSTPSFELFRRVRVQGMTISLREAADWSSHEETSVCAPIDLTVLATVQRMREDGRTASVTARLDTETLQLHFPTQETWLWAVSFYESYQWCINRPFDGTVAGPGGVPQHSRGCVDMENDLSADLHEIATLHGGFVSVPVNVFPFSMCVEYCCRIVHIEWPDTLTITLNNVALSHTMEYGIGSSFASSERTSAGNSSGPPVTPPPPRRSALASVKSSSSSAASSMRKGFSKIQSKFSSPAAPPSHPSTPTNGRRASTPGPATPGPSPVAAYSTLVMTTSLTIDMMAVLQDDPDAPYLVSPLGLQDREAPSDGGGLVQLQSRVAISHPDEPLRSRYRVRFTFLLQPIHVSISRDRMRALVGFLVPRPLRPPPPHVRPLDYRMLDSLVVRAKCRKLKLSMEHVLHLELNSLRGLAKTAVDNTGDDGDWHLAFPPLLSSNDARPAFVLRVAASDAHLSFKMDDRILGPCQMELGLCLDRHWADIANLVVGDEDAGADTGTVCETQCTMALDHLHARLNESTLVDMVHTIRQQLFASAAPSDHSSSGSKPSQLLTLSDRLIWSFEFQSAGLVTKLLTKSSRPFDFASLLPTTTSLIPADTHNADDTPLVCAAVQCALVRLQVKSSHSKTEMSHLFPAAASILFQSVVLESTPQCFGGAPVTLQLLPNCSLTEDFTTISADANWDLDRKLTALVVDVTGHSLSMCYASTCDDGAGDATESSEDFLTQSMIDNINSFYASFFSRSTATTATTKQTSAPRRMENLVKTRIVDFSVFLYDQPPILQLCNGVGNQNVDAQFSPIAEFSFDHRSFADVESKLRDFFQVKASLKSHEIEQAKRRAERALAETRAENDQLKVALLRSQNALAEACDESAGLKSQLRRVTANQAVLHSAPPAEDRQSVRQLVEILSLQIGDQTDQLSVMQRELAESSRREQALIRKLEEVNTQLRASEQRREESRSVARIMASLIANTAAATTTTTPNRSRAGSDSSIEFKKERKQSLRTMSQ